MRCHLGRAPGRALDLAARAGTFATGDVFRASRLSSGNRLFPTQVLITPTSVVQYTPRWIGRQEQTIHMAHISSVKIETGMILSTCSSKPAAARPDPLPRPPERRRRPA